MPDDPLTVTPALTAPMTDLEPADNESGNLPDPVTEYHNRVAELRQAAPDTPPDFVDPHVLDEQAAAPDDVDGTPAHPDEDVDPPGLDSDDAEDAAPSTDDLLTGETDAFHPDASSSTDPVEDLAQALLAEDPQLTVAQAVTAARTAIAGEAAISETGMEGPGSTAAAALEAERRELDQQWRKGVRDMVEDATLDRLEARMAEIDSALPQARVADTRRGQAAQGEFDRCAAHTLDLYPDASRAGTPLYERMQEIHAALEAAGDPVISHQHKPLVIAQMAARELSIAPRRGVGGRRLADTRRPAAHAVSGGNFPAMTMTAALSPTPGQRRTEHGPTPLVREIRAIRSPQDYDRLIRGLTGRG